MASLNEVNKALYAALCMLRDEPEKRMPSWGICWNINQMTKHHLRLEPEMRKMVHDKFVEMAGKWPATKDRRGAYPVEGDFQVYDAHQRAYILWDNPRRLELLEWAIQKAEAGPPVYVWPDLSYVEVSEYNENEFRHKGDDFWRLDHPIYHDDGRLWV
ncbi:hypothetical protein pA_gene0017 [Aeromonas phage phiA008]|nr:hypothetical protein pA_gene0017 [Aeromonas phage phiA008]